jgi:hypothetical protein
MPKLSMTSLLSVTLLLSNGLTVIPPMIAAVAYGAWRAWYRPAHLVPANNPATTSPAEARMSGSRPAGSVNR